MPASASRRDPYRAYRFLLRIEGPDGAGIIAGGGFSECTGLEGGMDFVEYQEGGVNDRVHKFPGPARQSNIVLRRGSADAELNHWYERTAEGAVEPLPGSIRVFDESGSEVVMEWRFEGAFPCRWVGPELNALESRVAVEALELCHDGLRRTT